MKIHSLCPQEASNLVWGGYGNRENQSHNSYNRKPHRNGAEVNSLARIDPNLDISRDYQFIRNRLSQTIFTGTQNGKENSELYTFNKSCKSNGISKYIYTSIHSLLKGKIKD